MTTNSLVATQFATLPHSRSTLTVRQTITDSYNSTSEVRTPTSMGEANLISSELTVAPRATLNDVGRHAPLLDLDIPAVVVDTDAGPDLYVNVTGRLAGFRLSRLLTSLVAAGLARPEPSPRSRADRSAAYAAVQSHVRDDSAFAKLLVGLGPEFESGGFADLLVAVRDVAGPPATRPGPDMVSPWRIPLAVPVLLLPSTHFQHAYLEAVIDWPTWSLILKRLGSARVLQCGYVRASRQRRAAHLRLPWVAKTGDNARP